MNTMTTKEIHQILSLGVAIHVCADGAKLDLVGGGQAWIEKSGSTFFYSDKMHFHHSTQVNAPDILSIAFYVGKTMHAVAQQKTVPAKPSVFTRICNLFS